MVEVNGAWIHAGQVAPSHLHKNTEPVFFVLAAEGGRRGLSGRAVLVYPASLDLVCGEGQSYH